MALEIGESGQFQLDFAVTKIVTVLIFAIFLPTGYRWGQSKLPKQLGTRQSPAISCMWVARGNKVAVE